MAAATALVAAKPSALKSSQLDAPASLLLSESFQIRAPCVNCASTSSTSFSIAPSREARTFTGRGLRKYGNVLGQGKKGSSKLSQGLPGLRVLCCCKLKPLYETRPQLKRRRIRVQAAAAGEEGQEPLEAVSKRGSLEELDQQLKVFESRETSALRQVPIPRQVPGNFDKEKINGSLPKLQWPALSPGFFVYAGIGLFLLTLANNVLYRIFLGPPVVPREGFKTSVPVTPGFRITSRQQEREAREAREAMDAKREAIAAQSKEAPEPLE